MHMLRWMSSHKRREIVRNEKTHWSVGVALTEDKIRDDRR